MKEESGRKRGALRTRRLCFCHLKKEPQKFANVRVAFGASNVNNMLHVSNWAA
jgi:hypothetical protein